MQDHKSDRSDPSDIIRESVNADLTLSQWRTGLTFGTDAYLLAAFARPKKSERAVELGAGSGIVSLLCARYEKFKQITAIEIQEINARMIEKNTEENGLGNKIVPLCADLRGIGPADLGGEVGAVFANPPYMRADSGKRNETDEKYIARHEVCGGIADFCACAGRLLKTGGSFSVVFRPDRLSELMAALRAARLEPKRMTFVHADTVTPPSMVLIEALKDAAPALKVTPPLFLYRDGPAVTPRVMSEEAAAIYRDCRMGY